MSEDQKKKLEAQLCGIANLLRGKISAGDSGTAIPTLWPCSVKQPNMG